MTVFESLTVALFCIAMVFALLACVFGLIKLLSFIIRRITRKSRIPQPEPMTADGVTVSEGDKEDFSSGTLRLKNVDEPTAAMIMAIVSDESGIPLSELCFKSIKLIQSEKQNIN
ncbi:MAG: hypothetical protein K0R90_375 [Oscillospiraceae bacterium]|jgi:hypothetical protein|nr:hypothetical protein [Oscillospiraceae bacterium]